MLPDGFSDPITGFENPDRQAGRDTPHLTIGPRPWSFGGWSTSGRGAFAFAFASRGHSTSTSATHGSGTVEGRTLFLYLFFTFTVVDHVHVLGHSHGHVLGVVAVVDLGWRFA